MNATELCGIAPVIPVLTIKDAATAPDLARALVRGGLRVLEITLRTPAALDAVKAIAETVPDAIVGTGTVITPDDVSASVGAGARFVVSPGCTERLAAAAAQSGLPFLPGVSTASEAMRAAELGFDILKFFPAEQSGGVAVLKALAAPLPGLRFCPTGGISQANVDAYLGLANVACVGGSWVAPPDAVASGDWDRIEALAARASQPTGS